MSLVTTQVLQKASAAQGGTEQPGTITETKSHYFNCLGFLHFNISVFIERLARMVLVLASTNLSRCLVNKLIFKLWCNNSARMG